MIIVSIYRTPNRPTIIQHINPLVVTLQVVLLWCYITQTQKSPKTHYRNRQVPPCCEIRKIQNQCPKTQAQIRKIKSVSKNPNLNPKNENQCRLPKTQTRKIKISVEKPKLKLKKMRIGDEKPKLNPKNNNQIWKTQTQIKLYKNQCRKTRTRTRQIKISVEKPKLKSEKWKSVYPA